MIELMKFDMGGSACTLGAAKVIVRCNDLILTRFRLQILWLEHGGIQLKGFGPASLLTMTLSLFLPRVQNVVCACASRRSQASFSGIL